jgi:hypothetical protein
MNRLPTGHGIAPRFAPVGAQFIGRLGFRRRYRLMFGRSLDESGDWCRSVAIGAERPWWYSEGGRNDDQGCWILPNGGNYWQVGATNEIG